MKKIGLNVDAGFDLETPSNYITGGNPPSNSKAKTILKTQEKNLNQIIHQIKNKTFDVPNTIFWKKWIGTLISSLLKSYARKTVKKFHVTDQCTGCKICVHTCPRDLISLNKENKPVWNGETCEMCFSCINLCPQKAIENGKTTKNKNRYKNPEIKRIELLNLNYKGELQDDNTYTN